MIFSLNVYLNQRSQNNDDLGRFGSSTSSEYPEWFLTAFAVAEPEIFALASTGTFHIF